MMRKKTESLQALEDDMSAIRVRLTIRLHLKGKTCGAYHHC